MEQERRYNILVTGGKGFIGWNFINYLFSQDRLKFGTVVSVDAEDYAAINGPSGKQLCDPCFHYYKGRMGAIGGVLIDAYKIDLIVNFAAHTHVDNSIKGVGEFITNNIGEMATLADAARIYWKANNIDGKFIQISTDEVYGSVEDQGAAFSEFSFYHPNNPYSATKAAAEMLLKTFGHTYQFPFIITNCSNNYGPGQHEEKLIPKIIQNCLEGKKIPIYGDGQQKRDWIFVDDHCEGIVDAILYGRNSDAYLFGTNKNVTNLELTKTICAILDEIHPGDDPYENLIEFVEDRLGHDRTYRIDYLKSYTDLGWYPKTDLKDGLQKTVEWYHNRYIDGIMRAIQNAQLFRMNAQFDTKFI